MTEIITTTWSPVTEPTASWSTSAPTPVTWTVVTPSTGGGELDFSDPDNSGFLPGL